MYFLVTCCGCGKKEEVAENPVEFKEIVATEAESLTGKQMKVLFHWMLNSQNLNNQSKLLPDNPHRNNLSGLEKPHNPINQLLLNPLQPWTFITKVWSTLAMVG